MKDRGAIPRSRVLHAALSIVCLAAILVAADYGLYLRYVARLRITGAPAGDSAWENARAVSLLPSETLNDIGAFMPDAPGRYQSAPLSAGPGRVRVCAMGSSFTAGWEAGPGLDFPNRLQRIFRERGFSEVEIVNFAIKSLGLHQIVRLFDSFGRRYGCDLVILGPDSFAHPFWERTFNHGGSAMPYGIYGRYILKDGRDAFISPSGGFDFRARFDEYFRYVPRWAYLRYDVFAPAFIQCLRPRGPTILNPFYYFGRNNFSAETAELTRLLLARLAGGRAPVVAFAWAESLPRLPQGDSDVVIEKDHFEPRFPYLRVGHYSAAGAFLVAKEYFDVLTGAESVRLPVLAFSPSPARSQTRADTPDLRSFRRADILLGGVRVATLLKQTSLASIPSLAETADHPEDFAADGARFLLALDNTAGSERKWMDLLYVPLPFAPRPGMRAELELDTLLGRRRWDFGAVGFPVPGAPLAVVPFSRYVTPFSFLDERWFGEAGVRAWTVRSGRVLLDGRAVYRLRWMNGHLTFLPDAGYHVAALPLRSDDFDVDRLPEKGTVFLRLVGAETRLIACGSWKKIVRSYPHRGPGRALIGKRAAGLKAGKPTAERRPIPERE